MLWFDFDQAFCILVLVEFSCDYRLNHVASAATIARYVVGTSNFIRIFDTLTELYISCTLPFLGNNDPEDQPECLRWHIFFRLEVNDTLAVPDCRDQFLVSGRIG